MPRRYPVVVLGVIATAIASAGLVALAGDGFGKSPGAMSDEELAAYAKARVRPGDGSGRAEEFLTAEGWKWVRIKYATPNHYIAAYPAGNTKIPLSKVVLYVYLDEADKVDEIKVRREYAMP
jgi:hypothetical protein